MPSLMHLLRGLTLAADYLYNWPKHFNETKHPCGNVSIKGHILLKKKKQTEKPASSTYN